MHTEIIDKKKFLRWFAENIRFSRREAYWIINYLMTHESILNQIHFVEESSDTPRGLKITESKPGQEALQLFLNGIEFNDPEQIFHEIRFNWQQELYLECQFCGAWRNSDFLAILEDNPFKPWNQQVSDETKEEIENSLQQIAIEGQKEKLEKAINDAIDCHDEKMFAKLSQELSSLKER